MLKSDYDASVYFLDKIRLAERHAELARKNGKKTHQRGYENDAMMWREALSFYLQDLLCQRYPGRPQPMVLTCHVIKLLDQIGDGGDKKNLRANMLDTLEKVLEISTVQQQRETVELVRS